MRGTIAIDSRGYAAMVNGLSRMSGTPVENVILADCGAIIGRCIQLTPRRTPERIRKTVEFRNRTLWEGGDPDNAKKRGRFIAGFDKGGAATLFEESNWDGTGWKGYHPKLRGSRSFHYMTEFQHWSDTRWARWQAVLQKLKEKAIDVAAAVRSSGASKATWFQMAIGLGIESMVRPAPPGYVRNAVSRDGRVYTHGYGQKIRTPSQFYVVISNDSPLVVNKLGGARILSQAVRGRIQGYMTNLRKGVFKDLAVRAQRYPGVFLK